MAKTNPLVRPLIHCPYCKDSLEDFRAVIACAPCGARHHEDCYRELDRCASCGSVEMLIHRTLPRRLQRQFKVDALRFLGIIFATVIATTVITAAIMSEPKHSALQTPEHKRPSIERERAELADAFRRREEQLAEEHADWIHERDRVLKETAEEKENARQLARRGWHVAEIVALASPLDPDYATKVSDALRLLPDGPSVLRDALEMRRSEANERLHDRICVLRDR